MQATPAQPLDNSLRRYLRIVATGSGFALFGLGAVALSALVFFPILLLPVSLRRKRLWSRWVISQSLRFYLFYFRLVGLIQAPRINGLHHLLDGNHLIVASHPSLIDVLFLISLVRNTNCIVKSLLWRNPFTIGPVHALGYIRNDSNDLVQQCARSLRRGDSLVIFPEGTRTRDDQPLKFLRGAANIALEADQPVTPVIIRCEPPMLRKGQKWYQVPKRTPLYTIDVYPRLDPGPNFAPATTRSVAARQLTREMEDFFRNRYLHPDDASTHRDD